MSSSESRPIVFVREPSPRLVECELTHLARTALDARLALDQHRVYAHTLAELGAQVHWLPPLPDNPDGVFVEDTAVVTPEIAVIARPGAASRQSEVDSTASALAAYRPLRRIQPPACLDGGDVLRIGRTLYVGASTRTNTAGAEQLRTAVEPFGYDVRIVPTARCLHLKTGVTFVPPGFIVINPAWIDPSIFAQYTVIDIDEREPFAANTLTLNGTTLVSADCPRTADKLDSHGIRVRPVHIGELHKAEAGLTCLSIVI